MTVVAFLVSKVAFATGIAVVAEVVRRRSRRVEVGPRGRDYGLPLAWMGVISANRRLPDRQTPAADV